VVLPSPRPSRRLLAPAVLVFVLAGATVAFAAPSASIEQVRNGQASSPTTPIPTWGTGNAGASNSHYLESHSIAYRTIMDGLPTDGTVIELTIGYDVKRSGSYALDYLTQYQRLLPHVLFAHRDPEVFDPLNGVSGVGPTVTTAPIPVPTRTVMIDPDGADPEPAMPQPSTSAATLPGAERVMTLYGGTLIDVTYVTEGDVNLATGSSESQVKVRFKADSPKAVLAWGGHIACRWDWGFNADGTARSAAGISGSSYHMRLVTWNLGNLGNQDRSMSTDAVFPVPRCGISNYGPFCAGSTNTHSAPSGMESYLWTLIDNTSGASIVGSATGTSVVVQAGANAGNYTLVLTTGASGFTKQCQSTITVNAPATADAGPDQAVCTSSPQVQLAGVVGGGNGAWSGGAGTYAPNAATMNAVYTPTAAEIAAGSVTLTLTSTPASGPCPSASDPVKITFQKAATANAGADLVVCATSPQAQLAGIIGGGASSGSWSGGGGAFTPSASALNAVYTPTAAEIAAGSVTLTLTSDDPAGPCDAASDQVKITINPAATADAGADLVVCASAPQAQLAGAVGGGASSGTWSGGAGTFSPNSSTLAALYTPTAAEIAAGSVTLTLTTNDPAGPCGAVSDQVKITINPAATVNAGADVVVCASAPQAQLAGTVGGGASSGSWSGGAGTYSPSASALNAVYTPSAAEIAAGSVTLTLTTNDPAGPCGAVGDQVKITIAAAATANAGADINVCSSSPQAQLAGAVGGAASTGTWSGGAGTFSPNTSALNAVYTPTPAEIAAGGVTLTLTTNDPAGPCGAVADQVLITISPAATVNAGADLIVCSTSPQAQLAGSVGGGASGGTWSGGGGTYSPSASSLTAVYTPSAAEIAAGSVTLTLTTNDPAGPCGPVGDQVKITIDPAATVNAGADQLLCAGSPLAHLAGTVGGGASGGAWSGGAGVFSPNATTVNATYMPTASEIAAGSVTLTLTTNDPAGPCGAVSDQMKIRFDPITVVNAGPDQAVCSSSPLVHLQGSVSGTVSSGTWSGGAGTYSPNAATLNATYTPSLGEIAAGGVTLTLTSASPTGPCPPASDQVTLTIGPAATVNAGPDQTVCAADPRVTLAGVIGGSATGATWSGGAGTYNPNASTLSAVYTPSAGEIAAGGVTLTLTTNDPAGPCPAVSDPMRITVDAPTVSVPNRVVCSGITPVTLCANVGNGIAPYTYKWSNGATGSCITVANPGYYAVSVTDARGCVANATGMFAWRDCVGMLAHTITTCSSYMSGTGDPLLSTDVNWVTKDNVITSISPGVFFYYTKITAPSPNFTVQLVQTKDNPAFPFCGVQQVQVSLFDSNCNSMGGGTVTGPGQASVDVQGVTAGQVFIIAVKYSLKDLVGTYMDETMGCHYDFKTVINGQIVDADPDGLQVGVAGGHIAGSGGKGDVLQTMSNHPAAPANDLDALELYRPAPNPFRDGMQMAYAVDRSAAVRISVYDLAGRLVRTLAEGVMEPGRYRVAWDGKDVHGARAANGMYFVHVRIGAEMRQLRVMFVN
jgi:hypothetical protein